jgi:hypothetical protein
VGRGTGPGAITPDGCAVDVYRVLPAMGEPEVVHGAIPAGAGTLELGAGAGLAVDAYLTGDGSWVRAVPVSRGRALGRSPR